MAQSSPKEITQKRETGAKRGCEQNATFLRYVLGF